MPIVWRKNVRATNTNAEVPYDADKEDGLEAHTGKRKHMFTAHHQNAGHNFSMIIVKPSFRKLVTFKYLGMTLSKQFLYRFRRLPTALFTWGIIRFFSFSRHLILWGNTANAMSWRILGDGRMAENRWSQGKCNYITKKGRLERIRGMLAATDFRTPLPSICCRRIWISE
jgi:hypothetical protein